jgi:hypothetical protein
MVNGDAVTLDALRALKAADEQDAVAVLAMGAAVLQQQMMILAALGATEQKVNQPTVVRETRR